MQSVTGIKRAFEGEAQGIDVKRELFLQFSDEAIRAHQDNH